MQEFRKAQDRGTPVRFKLNAVDALKSARAAGFPPRLRREAHDCIQPSRRRIFSLVGQCHFDPVGETRKCHFKLRMSCVQVLEFLAASGNDRRLQLG